MSLNYVNDNAFSGVMKEIDIIELSLIIDGLPNNKAAGLFEIPNELWKHCGEEVLACLLKLLNLSILTEINKEIKHHIQQKYLITYTNKSKKKLQTSAVTLQRIQLPTWKKTRVESPTNLSYHYTPRSTINISSTDAFTSNVTSTFGQLLFQSNQKKAELLGTYDFGTASSWKVMKSEEKENKNQEFNYQNPIPKNSENQNPNIQTPKNQNNLNSDIINQQYLFQVIIINQPPIKPIVIILMTYVPITKLEKFTGKEDNAQAISYFLQDTTNLWYQSLINKPIIFDVFKTEFLRYFNNHNSINHLANTFTTIKQEKTKAITIYLGHFHRHLCQIQILNQFIYRLCNFEFAKLEANYVQAVNLVMNRLSDLNSKLKQFRESINQKLEGYLANNNQAIYQPLQKHNNQENSNSIILTFNISTGNIYNISTTTATTSLLILANSNTTTKSNSNVTWKPKTKIHSTKLEISNNCSSTNLHLLVTPEDASSNKPEPNQKQLLTSNIPPATITNDKFLAAIFSFKLKKATPVSLFSEVVLNAKPITVMYTDAKVDGHSIKLILDSRIITADKAIKIPIGKIDDFLFEVNGITITIKVLVMEAIQYQALIGNDWLVKTNAILDWTMQKLQLSQNN
ncbi:hypothetical protein G9A89_023155 [Geosiphon pyriformis]|nr:hypothetical protein G9A89_023155 [Geosiphon pyriformis]